MFSQSDTKGTAAGEFTLELLGAAHTKVHYMEGSGDSRQRRTAKETQELLQVALPLAAFGGKVDGGDHKFPFGGLMLPPTVPPTMQV